jgi:DNA-binding FadR family transcriptional regulator
VSFVPRADNGSSDEPSLGRRDGSLVEAATEAISSQILTGQLGAGDKLPTERELVEQLRVSRTVLREALSSLEALGLLETRSTRGRWVAAGGSSERSRTLVGAWLNQHAREILEVDEIRSVLEGHAIRSMSKWDAIDAARKAGRSVREQTEAVERGDAVAAAEGDAAFHRTLGSYTQNGALRTLMNGLIDASRKGAYAVYSLPETAAGSIEQHRGIVNALAVADIESAARLAQEHMLDVARRYSTAASADGEDDRSRDGG